MTEPASTSPTETTASPGVPFGGRVADRAAGLGVGWTKLAAAIAKALPADRVERLWLFPPVRHEEREWGTAVVAVRGDEDRLQVHTATYILIIRGRERGQARLTVDEVGAGPEAVLSEVVRGVQERAGETEPPVEIDPALWFEAHEVNSATPEALPGRDTPRGNARD